MQSGLDFNSCQVPALIGTAGKKKSTSLLHVACEALLLTCHLEHQKHNELLAIQKMLLEAGCSPTASDDAGLSAVAYASLLKTQYAARVAQDSAAYRYQEKMRTLEMFVQELLRSLLGGRLRNTTPLSTSPMWAHAANTTCYYAAQSCQ
eukprot:jgi/Mesvir1/11669/Mv24032-RA.1